MFFKTWETKNHPTRFLMSLPRMLKPMLLSTMQCPRRKKNGPDYTILQYLEGHQSNEQAYNSEIARDRYWGVFFWSFRRLDLIHTRKIKTIKFWSIREHGVSSFEVNYFSRHNQGGSITYETIIMVRLT